MTRKRWLWLIVAAALFAFGVVVARSFGWVGNSPSAIVGGGVLGMFFVLGLALCGLFIGHSVATIVRWVIRIILDFIFNAFRFESDETITNVLAGVGFVFIVSGAFALALQPLSLAVVSLIALISGFWLACFSGSEYEKKKQRDKEKRDSQSN